MTYAGCLGHPFTELDVLRFIERAFLSKHTLGTYNHSGSEFITVLSSCLHRRRRGSVGVPTGHHHQATSLLQLPHAPKTFPVLGQTTVDLPCARTLTDLLRGKSELIAENALLRQQLSILHRQIKRPVYKKTDRLLLVLLASMVRTWKQALYLVQAETLLRWP